MQYKAQSAIEFVVLIGAMMIFFISLSVVFNQNITQKTIEQRDLAINDLVLAIQSEIDLAANSKDGYVRTFNVPNEIVGLDYTIVLNDNIVYLETINKKHAIAIPIKEITINTNLQKGDNTIRKIDGEVILN
jgi:hypothetical protein